MAFKKAARERNEILLTLFNAYETEVERINGSQNELKIQIEFKGDRETFKNQLKSDFRGTSISEAKYQVISEKFNDYVALVEDWILNGGKEIQGSSSKTPVAKPDGTKMFCSAFLNDARMCCFFANAIVKY